MTCQSTEERAKKQRLTDALKELENPPELWTGSETLKVGFHLCNVSGTTEKGGEAIEVRECQCCHGGVVMSAKRASDTSGSGSRSVRISTLALFEIAEVMGLFDWEDT